MVVSQYFLLEQTIGIHAPELIAMNCLDEQNKEDKVLMLMNVVPVKSDMIQEEDWLM